MVEPDNRWDGMWSGRRLDRSNRPVRSNITIHNFIITIHNSPKASPHYSLSQLLGKIMYYTTITYLVYKRVVVLLVGSVVVGIGAVGCCCCRCGCDCGSGRQPCKLCGLGSRTYGATPVHTNAFFFIAGRLDIQQMKTRGLDSTRVFAERCSLQHANLSDSQITFIWILGHIGLPEHDAVDKSVKQATISLIIIYLPQTIKIIIAHSSFEHGKPTG